MKGLLMFVLLTDYLDMNALSVHVNEFWQTPKGSNIPPLF